MQPCRHAIVCALPGRSETRAWYLRFENKYPDFGPSFIGWLLSAVRWAILINGVIPISLYVTLEVVKVRQWDDHVRGYGHQA